MQHLGSDGDGLRRHVQTIGDLIAALIAHPVQQDVLHGQPPPEQPGVLAVAGHQPVIFSKSVHGPERRRLLAPVLRIRSHPPRSLQLERDPIEVPADGHVLIELDHVLVADEIPTELGVEVAVLVENRDVLDVCLEHGLDRHAGFPHEPPGSMPGAGIDGRGFAPTDNLL